MEPLVVVLLGMVWLMVLLAAPALTKPSTTNSTT
jgi:hypothetical protein